MNLSLPDDLQAFLEQQVAEQHYNSASEYIGELIRRQRDVEALRE